MAKRTYRSGVLSGVGGFGAMFGLRELGKSAIGTTLSELVILVVAREWTQDYEWMVHQPSLAFYLQQPALREDPVPGGLALTRADRLAKQTLPVDVVAQRAGWVLVQRKP